MLGQNPRHYGATCQLPVALDRAGRPVAIGAVWLKVRPTPIPGVTALRESIDTLLARGTREHHAGAHDRAIELYHKVLQKDPVHPQTHYNLGQIYQVRGEYAKAQREYEVTLEAEPQSMTARLNLGTVLYRQVQFAAAAREFQKTVDAFPKNPLALFDLGVTLLEVGQTDEAIRFLKAALEQDPKGADTCYYLGLAFERQPRW